MENRNLREVDWGFIPNHWEVKTTEEITDFITDYVANGSFASLAENVNYKSTPDYAALIRLTDYNNNFKGNFVYVDKRAYDFLKKSKLEGGEVIISNVGAYAGTVFLAPKLDIPTTLGPNSIMMNFKTDNLFYYYWLKSLYGQHMLEGIISGSAQPKFNKTSFRKLEVPVPPLPEQKAIASVLSSLDDKIYLLHQQNQTLEALAETLFRQWFIEEAKEDWEERPLSSIANFLNGLACQKFPPKDSINRLPVLKIKDLTSGISENSDWATTDVKPEYIIRNGDVIFAWSASLMVKIWDGEDCILNQHLFKVTSEEFPKWFYYFWCKQHLREFISIAQSHATTMGHIKRSDLDEAMVLIPDNDEIEKMTFQMNPILDKIQLNNNQINSLSKLRDTLLPKLMSGEVRVKM
ncbi:restriction endonuclease subunit S [Empedobacter sp. R132-2]|uniref:restriction endonuclease subunit S n=1 Tax=Empedobacter sp. R132-2 TaxID=2746740 RepID=UPI002578C88B|nr:restriction endonuclease subunit S [Empedobacter sp. R132-2]MDM1137838.1 restriction endonuclease subunit S [Empedobacter sp. R132-2]